MCMRIFKVRDFSKWAKSRISDGQLKEIVTEMERGIVGDKLGADLYKKRLPIHGRGKRGGARSIVAYKAKNRIFFMYAYDRKEGDKKKEQAEISKEAIKAYQIIGKELIAMPDNALDKELQKGSIIEI